MKTRNIILIALATLFVASCAVPYKVVEAPHRTAITARIPGTVQHSHPVKVSKNIGFGRTVGSVGGAVLGASFGGGTGRYIGASIGRFAGSIGGNKGETHYRKKDAQEVMVKLKGKSHKLISMDQPTFKTGDKIWANTNIYGEPITITPR